MLAHELTHTVQQGAAVSRVSNIQRNGDPVTDAPQFTDLAIGINDTLPTECGDITPRGLDYLQDFLLAAHSELTIWGNWRNQVNWEDPAVSGQIPSMAALLVAFQNLSGVNLPCTESTVYAIPITHTEVRNMLDQGVRETLGLSIYERQLMSEWMQYERNRFNGLQAYFNLAPNVDVEHTYTIHVTVGLSNVAGVGIGLGGALESPVVSIKFGCYPKLGVSSSIVGFRYRNNLGMTWEQGYLQANVGLSAECAIGVSLGPTISGNLGDEELCTGTADPDPTSGWYGPMDMSGGTFEQGISVSSGLGLEAEVGASYLYLIIPGKNNLSFDTSGTCMQFELGGQLAAAVNLMQVGGQIDIGDIEGGLAKLNPSGGVCNNGLVQTSEYLIQRNLYFDTGNSEPQLGANAESNHASVNTILETLTINLGNRLITGISVSVIGHSSPRFRGATSSEQADQENKSLAGERAYNSVALLYEGLINYPGGLPPVSIAVNTVSELGSPINDVDFNQENRGAREGLAETEDRDNDYQRYRKVEIKLSVQRLVDQSINIMYDARNSENNVCE